MAESLYPLPLVSSPSNPLDGDPSWHGWKAAALLPDWTHAAAPPEPDAPQGEYAPSGQAARLALGESEPVGPGNDAHHVSFANPHGDSRFALVGSFLDAHLRSPHGGIRARQFRLQLRDFQNRDDLPLLHVSSIVDVKLLDIT